MSKRFVYGLLFTAVLVVLGLFMPSPVQGAASNAPANSVILVGAFNQQGLKVSGDQCHFTNEELSSLQSVYFEDAHAWLVVAQSIPIGYDGGLHALEQCRLDN